MNVKTMESLMGANANANLMATPMKYYKEAQLKGDTEKMERAMGYVSDFSDKAQEYNTGVSLGLEQEAEEAREAQKAELKEKTESARGEHAKEPAVVNKNVKTNADGDTAEISEDAEIYAAESAKAVGDAGKVKENTANEQKTHIKSGAKVSYKPNKHASVSR